MEPCCLFEDEHLLAVHKPAGWNTHAPAPHAGEGIYDWLRHREPRWASLAIIHRLDKETSGVLVFAKSREANRSLTRQFAEREVRKEYRLLTDGVVPFRAKTVRTGLRRAGDRYVAVAERKPTEAAVTRFRWVGSTARRSEWIAEPLTGRTHQVRVHAQVAGIPIVGDCLYGGRDTASAARARLCLHAERLRCRHPTDGRELEFYAAADFGSAPGRMLRGACIDGRVTNTYRLAHGGADGVPGYYLDRLGDYLLLQTDGRGPTHARASGAVASSGLEWALGIAGVRGGYVQVLERRADARSSAAIAPRHDWGILAPPRFDVVENGVRYGLSFAEGYSVGLFLDQRDNRRRFLVNHVAAGFALREEGMRGASVLNAFAYTCGFSVCAALAGATVTSLDLSRKYLEWGKGNFTLNGLDPGDHVFLASEVFEGLRRLSRRGRRFDVVVLDPPTFSRSKTGSVFRVEKDYGRLIEAALAVLRQGGVLLASANAKTWRAQDFETSILGRVQALGWRVERRHYAPQPPDFPVTREEPAYLKTLWLRLRSA